MSKKKPLFKIKTQKEIQDDWKKNWMKFQDGFNEFFKIPLNVKSTAIDHNSKGSAIDITPEENISEIENKKEATSDTSQKYEIIEGNGSNPMPSIVAVQWQNNWNSFAEDTKNNFNDMKSKIDGWNQQNLTKWEENIKIGKANYHIWLKKNEIKIADEKEKQKIAMVRFKQWAKESDEKNKEFFEKQKDQWDIQMEKWRFEQKHNWTNNREKWEENRGKFKVDYDKWIEDRREQSLEKAKYKMQVSWRRNLNLMMSLTPIIVVVILILILVNAFTN